MCKRTTRDPLVRLFLDSYHLNLLLVPRAGAAVGDLYVEIDGQVSSPGHIKHLLGPTFMLPPLAQDEVLSDLAGTLSRSIDLKVGLGLLQNFWMAAVGAAAPIDKIEARYRDRSATHVRFRFKHATRDRVDPLELGRALIGQSYDARHPLVRKNNRFYLTTAVVRSASLSVAAEDSAGQEVELDAEALSALATEIGLKTEYDRSTEISFVGQTALAIGVELHELIFSEQRGEFTFRVPDDYVPTRAAEGLTPAFIGAPDGDALIRWHAGSQHDDQA